MGDKEGGLTGQLTERELFNRWDDEDLHTLQSQTYKVPVLRDGARSGGTESITLGTFGTTVGTAGFNIPSGWAYVVKSIHISNDQAGTFGTSTFQNILIDNIPIGTVYGTLENLKLLYGDYPVAVEGVKVVSSVNCGTGVNGTNNRGTFKNSVEVSGWRFKTVD